MENNCNKEQCAHFIDKDSFSHYHNKFIWIIVIATIAVALLFALISHFYNKSLSKIVSIHENYNEYLMNVMKPVEIASDSCIYVNDQLALSMQEHMQSTQTLLQIQSQKIQSDFTILSVWAGILMIVFLVFSIYSMFKTDEIIKQAKIGLDVIENAREKVNEHIKEIDDHVSGEMTKVSNEVKKNTDDMSKKYLDFINDIENQVAEEKDRFKGVVDEKTKEFQNIYKEYVERLKQSTETNENLMNLIIKAIGSNQAEEKKTEIKDEKGEAK